MKKMSKIVAVIAAMTVAVSLCLFAGCGGNYSETYNGALSEQTYTSEEKAAQAFLSEEIGGSSSVVVYSKVKVEENALSEEEVEKLAIEDTSGVEYVKKATVFYTESNVSAYAAATGTQDELQQMLYIVKYVNGGYKYYSPALSSGENLTKSYFNDVFNGERYANVTISGKMASSAGVKMSYQGTNTDTTVNIDMSYTYQITENAVYLKMTETQRAPDETTGKPTTQTGVAEGYVVKTNKGYVMYSNISGSYQVMPLAGISGGADMVWGSIINDTDHTGFKKTATGFQMDKESCLAIMERQFGDIFESYEFGSLEDLIKEMQFDFYVTEGNVSGVKQKLAMGLTVNESGANLTVAASASADYSFSKFGSTSVTVPEDVIAAITAKGYTIVTAPSV